MVPFSRFLMGFPLRFPTAVGVREAELGTPAIVIVFCPATRKPAAVLTAVKDKPLGWPPRVAAILDRRSTRRRRWAAVGTEEWLPRGQTKECTPSKRHANFS